MNKEIKSSRLLVLLLVTWLICTGFYFLPDQIGGWKMKQVDLLSDLRIRQETVMLDSLRREWEQPDTLLVDSVVLRDSLFQETGIDSIALMLRDSLYRIMAAERNADSTGAHIEDYSVGHLALKRFFAALNRRTTDQRPVRIAFLGDSFIEGDILVADFRSLLQKRFGGRGVGFIPVHSVAAQYRPTIETHAKGWQTWSMLTDQTQRYTLSGMLFQPAEEEPVLRIKTTARYPESDTVSTIKLLYAQNYETEMKLTLNGGKDTICELLPPTEEIAQYESSGLLSEAHFSFQDTTGFRPLGVAFEDEEGVIVDNYSLRGNSGMILSRLDSARCRQLNAIRPYDLIVMQYGLNVVTDTVLQYGWYGKRMEEVVRHVRVCFPDADLLLLGVSDRSRQIEGRFETMPAVLALLHTQRKVARRTGVAFWNVFGAMGGENSMVRFVENNWASKDYTHLSFRGGREIAKVLYEALLLEKKFYDEADKMAR